MADQYVKKINGYLVKDEEARSNITSLGNRVSNNESGLSSLNASVNEMNNQFANKANRSELHSHSNKTVLDGITSSKVEQWDSAYELADSAIGHLGSYETTANASAKLQEAKKYTDDKIDLLIGDGTLSTAFDTLKEVDTYLTNHKTEATNMLSAINANTQSINTCASIVSSQGTRLDNLETGKLSSVSFSYDSSNEELTLSTSKS